MSIIRCPRGHFYDDEKYEFCPTCEQGNDPGWRMENEKTISLEMVGGMAKEIRLTAEEPVKQSVKGYWDSDKTVAMTDGASQDFLVGWLVCIAGSMLGKDFRLYFGFNRVGRDLDSDICIQDPMVSGHGHCSVVYDEKGGQFYLVPGKGTVTYLNGERAQEASVLHGGDRISVGESVLEFVPFCRGDHTWKTIVVC